MKNWLTEQVDPMPQDHDQPIIGSPSSSAEQKREKGSKRHRKQIFQECKSNWGGDARI